MYLWILVLSGALLAASHPAEVVNQVDDEDPRTPWSLPEALYTSSHIRGFNGSWISDTEFHYPTEGSQTRRIFDVASNESREFIGNELSSYGSATFVVSPDQKHLLVRYDVTSIFRHSTVAKYDIYNLATKQSSQILGNQKLSLCDWSPTSEGVAYVFANNVYIHFLNGTELMLTTDGVEGIIYNGAADWVYEEEVLGSGNAIRWSPNGQRLAIITFNDTEVQTFKYHLYGDSGNPAYQYPQEVDLKYPKAGTPNPKITLKVIDLNEIRRGWTTLPAPVDVVTADHILQEIIWTDNDTVLAVWLNRRQNVTSLQQCNTQGACRQVISLQEPKGWNVIGTPQCTANGKLCFFTNWIGNWLQIWKLDLETGENLMQAMGAFTVLRIYGYDEQKDALYYQATLESDVTQSHVFRNDECLSCDSKDVDGVLCKQAAASFSKGFSNYVLSCSGPNPTYIKLYKTEGNSEVISWQDNSVFRAQIKNKLLPTVRFIKVPLGDSFTGIAKFYLPPGLNWDSPDPKKKYPMIVNVYGGPDSVRANNAFTVGFEGFMTTSHNTIYVVIDGRGTGNKGKDLLYAVNNRLGTVEIEDQIEVTRYLQKTYSFIDAERCGIWGWSYGGYATAMALSKDTDRVFQCGVSVAPVSSWTFYDTIYTERFMGLPTVEDNLANYRNGDIMHNIENFKHHDFLLIHGSGDDNVHVQNSMVLARTLQRNDILFEEMVYPDADHSIGIYLDHLYKTMDHFWINCLNLDVEETDD